MKRHLIGSILCGAITLLAPCAFGQGSATSSPAAASSSPSACPGKCEGMWLHHRQHELEFLTKALNLTPTQQSQIKALLEQRYNQLKALHEDTSMSIENRKEKAKAIFKDTHEKIMAVLTPDQKEKMQQIRKHHMEKEESASNCSNPNCNSSMCPGAGSSTHQ